MWWASCHDQELEVSLSVLGDILQASDHLSRVINSYKTVVEGQVINGEVAASTMPDSEGKMFQSPILDPSRPARQPTGPEGILSHSKGSLAPEAGGHGQGLLHLPSLYFVHLAQVPID